MPLKLRELCVYYDTVLLNTWDHTSQIASSLHNLTVVVMNLTGKSRVKTRPASYFHPFRQKKKPGMKITKKNFKDLKMIGKILSGK